MSPEGGGAPPVDAAGDGRPASVADATADATGGVPAGEAPAGKAGVDTFCTQICNHEQSCAAAADASTAALSGCAASCESTDEAPAANPPTELLRTDYVQALGSCIAASSCAQALQTSEVDCAEAIASGSSDAGVPHLVPSQAVATFCTRLAASPCSADGGAQDCASTFSFYGDVTLNAATACFSDATCSAVAACYEAAFMQQ